MFKQEWKYYLDTNSVRKLAPCLKGCKNVGAFISIWTICEMLGHVFKHPVEYDKIKSNLKAIQESGMSIVMMMPLELHYKAFSIPIPSNITSHNVLIMALLLMIVDSYEKWLKKIDFYSLSSTCEFVKEIDNATPRLNLNIKQQFDNNISTRESIRKYKEFWRTEDKELTHKRLLEYYVDGFIEDHEDIREMGVLLGMSYEELKQLLCDAYDGSIDVAFRVNACMVDKKVCYRELFRRNDDTDMMHLYYLIDDTKFVTDDNRLRENINAEFPGRAMSVEEFRKIL